MTRWKKSVVWTYQTKNNKVALCYLIGSTSCSQLNGHCSHICLPNPQGHQCVCPEGILLKPDDALSCEGGKARPRRTVKWCSHIPMCIFIKQIQTNNVWWVSWAISFRKTNSRTSWLTHSSFPKSTMPQISIKPFPWVHVLGPVHTCYAMLSSGVWIQMFFFCKIVNRCPQLSAPIHGSLEPCSTLPGKTCHLSCDRGYILNGSTTRTCNSDGTWTGTQTQCNGKCAIVSWWKYREKMRKSR